MFLKHVEIREKLKLREIRCSLGTDYSGLRQRVLWVAAY